MIVPLICSLILCRIHLVACAVVLPSSPWLPCSSLNNLLHHLMNLNDLCLFTTGNGINYYYYYYYYLPIERSLFLPAKPHAPAPDRPGPGTTRPRLPDPRPATLRSPDWCQANNQLPPPPKKKIDRNEV
jgi:hypothetical protein